MVAHVPEDSQLAVEQRLPQGERLLLGRQEGAVPATLARPVAREQEERFFHGDYKGR